MIRDHLFGKVSPPAGGRQGGMVTTRGGGPVAKNLWERGAADRVTWKGRSCVMDAPSPLSSCPPYGLLMRPYGAEQRGEGRGGGPAGMVVTGAVAPLGHL